MSTAASFSATAPCHEQIASPVQWHVQLFGLTGTEEASLGPDTSAGEIRRMRFEETCGVWQERRLTQEEAARLPEGVRAHLPALHRAL